MHIGLLSDTHGFLDPKVFDFFAPCDEIWHAGDFGSLDVSQQLSDFKPLQGVYGNIDGQEIRQKHPLDLHLTRAGLRIWLTHIGGYPNRYNKRIRPILKDDPPNIFVCGHSHILKVVRDPRHDNMLVLNPGAAGRQGFHLVRTALRFRLHNASIRDLDVIELGPRTNPLPP